ncbi:MAG: alpha/beta hydrolase [Gammaproteobacteria bacterium]|nr:alpha/beta hydrolase [Gammaproteobacteria bacterium]MDE0282974.1 alpha/beta hydrolase [Gammaproteobacteria bacterium]MDE0510687.1 alpha/beta hydrolase [Gammaproteobacteria bacterium]
MTEITGARPHQPAVSLQAQTRPARDSGIRFRSGNRSLWSNILFKLKPRRKDRPHRQFTVRLPARKHAFTNNLAGVRDRVFGEQSSRRDMYRRSEALISQFNRQREASPSLNERLSVEIGQGERLSGFSASANPHSPELDRSKPVILYLSGSNGPAEKYGGELATHFARDKGVNFVALNYRGFGDSSDVAPTEKTITSDGFAMINHLLEQGFKPENIIVHGYSMGASVAARIQARVEASGHRLAGAVYDRPMSSATGAAKAEAEADLREELLDPRGAGNVFSSLKPQVYAFGTKITVGSMSARRSLERLKRANPDGLRSPTFVTYDTGTFGERSRRMGERLGVVTLATQNHHEDHRMTIKNALSDPALQAIYD